MSNKWEKRVGSRSGLGALLDLGDDFGVHHAAGYGWKAAFRHRQTGQIMKMPAFHDVTLLPGSNGEWDEAVHAAWEDGFVDPKGKFYTREQAYQAIEVDDSMLLPHNWSRAEEIQMEMMEKQSRRKNVAAAR